MKVVLHRRDRATWEFTPNPKYGMYAHVTKKGTVYLLCVDDTLDKPFWIGRLVNNECTCIAYENILRAEKLAFPLGGVYWFPK